MSEENVEIVRRIYEAWRHGSLVDSGLLDPEIEWINAAEAVEPGTRRGVEAFAAAAGTVADTFDTPQIAFERFIEAGERVVVIGVLRGRGHGSGVEIERRQGYVWTIRDGRAVRFQWFNEPREALAAAGLEE